MKIQVAVLLAITSFVTAESWTINAWKQQGCNPGAKPDYPRAVLEYGKCHTFTKDHKNAVHSIAVATNSGNLGPVKFVAELFASSDCTDTRNGAMHKAVDLWAASGCVSTTPDVLSAKLTVYPGLSDLDKNRKSSSPPPGSKKKNVRREKGRTI
ncbi:hypothetical protein B0O99DRAFT_676615 [Bisporella sp. PMI_857]|nr:hypothetical protein B0O99DRAFT_676615 [Bisporella sp. PMI_857]